MRILYLLDFALQWTAIGLEIYCLYIQCVFCTLVEKTVYRELGWLNAFSKERRGISVKRWHVAQLQVLTMPVSLMRQRSQFLKHQTIS